MIVITDAWLEELIRQWHIRCPQEAREFWKLFAERRKEVDMSGTGGIAKGKNAMMGMSLFLPFTIHDMIDSIDPDFQFGKNKILKKWFRLQTRKRPSFVMPAIGATMQ